MPYIKKEFRDTFGKIRMPENAGELNYVLTRIVDAYIAYADLSYQTLNEVVGVFECAKMELYRRIAAPYEDKKRRENGEVYKCLPKNQCSICAAPCLDSKDLAQDGDVKPENS